MPYQRRSSRVSNEERRAYAKATGTTRTPKRGSLKSGTRTSRDKPRVAVRSLMSQLREELRATLKKSNKRRALKPASIKRSKKSKKDEDEEVKSSRRERESKYERIRSGSRTGAESRALAEALAEAGHVPSGSYAANLDRAIDKLREDDELARELKRPEGRKALAALSDVQKAIEAGITRADIRELKGAYENVGREISREVRRGPMLQRLHGPLTLQIIDSRSRPGFGMLEEDEQRDVLRLVNHEVKENKADPDVDIDAIIDAAVEDVVDMSRQRAEDEARRAAEELAAAEERERRQEEMRLEKIEENRRRVDDEHKRTAEKKSKKARKKEAERAERSRALGEKERQRVAKEAAQRAQEAGELEAEQRRKAREAYDDKVKTVEMGDDDLDDLLGVGSRRPAKLRKMNTVKRITAAELYHMFGSR